MWSVETQAEAELGILSRVANEAKALKQFMSELGFEQQAITTHEDASSAIEFAENPAQFTALNISTFNCIQFATESKKM